MNFIMTEPKLAEVVISHSAGGSVDIKSYGKEKSNYGVFQSQKWVFDESWTSDDVEAFVEEKRQVLRDRVDLLGEEEHRERFNQSYMAGDYPDE